MRSHTEKGTTGLSLKKWKRERWAASIVPLSVCLPEVTHRKRLNTLKSKKQNKKHGRERREGERRSRFKSKYLACYCAAGSRYVNTMPQACYCAACSRYMLLCRRRVTVLHVAGICYYAAGVLLCCR